jgi:mannose-6-phosphate isomerase-like protein (cupin superfamily)
MSETIFTVEPLYADDERSVAQVTLHGVGRAVENNGSESTYKVLEGEGVFKVLDRKSIELMIIPVTEGDEVVIPQGTIYANMGDLVMQVTCKPPYDPAKVRIVQDIAY